MITQMSRSAAASVLAANYADDCVSKRVVIPNHELWPGQQH